MSRDIRKWTIAKLLILGTNLTFVIHQFLCPWETNLWHEITTSDALAFNYFQDLKSPSRLCLQNFLYSPLKGYFALSNVSCHLSRFSRWRCFNPKAYAVDTWFKILLIMSKNLEKYKTIKKNNNTKRSNSRKMKRTGRYKDCSTGGLTIIGFGNTYG